MFILGILDESNYVDVEHPFVSSIASKSKSRVSNSDDNDWEPECLCEENRICRDCRRKSTIATGTNPALERYHHSKQKGTKLTNIYIYNALIVYKQVYKHCLQTG